MQGYGSLKKSVIEPLRVQRGAARRIGDGDLDTPVQVTGPDEISHLAHSFDLMRVHLKAHQENLELQVRQRTRELTNAFEFSQEIVTELELERLLSSVVDRAKDLLDARASSVCLLTPEGKGLVLKASSGELPHSLELSQSVHEEPVTVQVISRGQTVVAHTGCSSCRFLQAYAPGECMATPLHTGDRTLGALCVVRAEQRQFDPVETQALTLLANSAATAITNAHLVEAEQEQARTTASLAEREKLAAELHDDLAQTLSFLNLKTDRLSEMIDLSHKESMQSELSSMKSVIGTAYGQVRAALVGLREPVITTEDDLLTRLEALVANSRQICNIQTELTIADASALVLSDVTQKQALHIVKESLNNAHRHAGAQHITVRVDRDNSHARFTIRDDGRGFDPSTLTGSSHYGLTIMRARAERVGGSLHIETSPGNGTKIVALLPLET